MLKYKEYRNNKPSSHVLLLTFALLIVVGFVFCSWPAVKGHWTTAGDSVVSNDDLLLTGILYTTEDPKAIVNGKIVRQQDIISNVKVVRILKNKVEFQKDGKFWTQTMLPVQQGLNSALPLLIQLGSPKCPPCRKMTPILDDLKNDYSDKFQIRFIDVWENRVIGARYGVVQAPTQIFYDSNGRERFRHVGFFSKKHILDIWKSLGIDI